MLRADYLVVTMPLTKESEAALPVMQAYWLPDPKPFALYGYRGYRSGKIFIGQTHDRVLIQATGAISHEVALSLPLPVEHELSVARIDVQITFVVQDADYFIQTCKPEAAYKSVIWKSINEPGATLYVGAPRSDCRLRMYNKSAESGINPQVPGDYLRVEIQFRNRYADRMFRAIRARAPRLPFLSHLRRMIDNYSFDIIKKQVEQEEEELFQDEEIKDIDEMTRRKAWIERSVLPAIRKVIAAEPEYRDIFISLLDNPLAEGLYSE